MPLSINALMRHLRASEPPVNAMGSKHKRQLRNIGYYHGYKGYRFVKNSNNRILISDFDDLMAIYSFDMALKTLIYPQIMFIETALKNYVLEAVLRDANSESFDDIFMRSMTAYKASPSKKYVDRLKIRLRARDEINWILRDNCGADKDPVIWHFLRDGKTVPIWAIFEKLTLGQFGNFYLSLDPRIKNEIAKELDLPRSCDGGKALSSMIFALKDLRNAVAHNKPVFDSRFKSQEIGAALKSCLETGVGTSHITFNSITDYVILMTYLLQKFQQTKTESKRFAKSYLKLIEDYWRILPDNTAARVAGTDTRAKINAVLASLKG